MYIDVFQHLEDLRARLGDGSRSYTSAVQAYYNHEDLRACLEGGRIRFCSLTAHPFLTDVEFDRGQDIYAHPYTEDGGVLIYSDPPSYLIGTRNSEGFGVTPAQGWTELMEFDSISSDVIKKIRDFLNANVPYNIE